MKNGWEMGEKRMKNKWMRMNNEWNTFSTIFFIFHPIFILIAILRIPYCGTTTLSITALSIKWFMALNVHDTQHKWHSAYQCSAICWVPLCSVSHINTLRWVSLCWMSWRRVKEYEKHFTIPLTAGAIS
jgi:hypothetical protein